MKMKKQNGYGSKWFAFAACAVPEISPLPRRHVQPEQKLCMMISPRMACRRLLGQAYISLTVRGLNRLSLRDLALSHAKHAGHFGRRQKIGVYCHLPPSRDLRFLDESKQSFKTSGLPAETLKKGPRADMGMRE